MIMAQVGELDKELIGGNSGEAGEFDNSFEPQYYLKDGLIYDPSYIHKFKGPTIHQIIAKINTLTTAVTSLQQVVTNLIEKDEVENRKVMVDTVWKYTKQCCDNLGIVYQPTSDVDLWDGEGVMEEGIEAYLVPSEDDSGKDE